MNSNAEKLLKLNIVRFAAIFKTTISAKNVDAKFSSSRAGPPHTKPGKLGKPDQPGSCNQALSTLSLPKLIKNKTENNPRLQFG